MTVQNAGLTIRKKKWSDEVKRIMVENELPEDEISETLNALAEIGV